MFSQLLGFFLENQILLQIIVWCSHQHCMGIWCKVFQTCLSATFWSVLQGTQELSKPVDWLSHFIFPPPQTASLYRNYSRGLRTQPWGSPVKDRWGVACQDVKDPHKRFFHTFEQRFWVLAAVAWAAGKEWQSLARFSFWREATWYCAAVANLMMRPIKLLQSQHEMSLKLSTIQVDSWTLILSMLCSVLVSFMYPASVSVSGSQSVFFPPEVLKQTF